MGGKGTIGKNHVFVAGSRLRSDNPKNLGFSLYHTGKWCYLRSFSLKLICMDVFQNTLKEETSQSWEIDPTQRNGRKNGYYTIVPAEFQINLGIGIAEGWDDTDADDWAAVGVGETNTNAELSLPGISSEAAAKLELVVPPESAAYVSISNNKITGEYKNFEIKGLKPTVAKEGCRIVVKQKADGASIATLHVNVFEKVEIKVNIYTVHDSRHNITDVGEQLATDAKIIDKLNEIYGPQANLHFTLNTTIATDLDMGENANDPNLFTAEGRFDLAFLQNVISKAQTPEHILPLYIVRQLSDLTKDGITNSERTFCFVNNLSYADTTAAHEVGHFLNLSTEKKGQGNAHDLGPWPPEVVREGLTALMYDANGGINSKWLRHQDWVEANKQAKQKFPK